MNTYYLARHGQTVWNTLGQTQGHGNSPLTELGELQAKDLAEAMKEHKIDMIFSSDLGRAIQTAEIVGKEIGVEVEQTENLREMGFGVWEGRKLSDVQIEYKEVFETWRNDPINVNIEGGETLFDVAKRVENLIEDLNQRYEGKNILLVSHSITVRVMLLMFLESDLKNIYRIKQDNTALNIIEFREYGPVVMKMNDTSHCKDRAQVSTEATSALE